MTTAKDEQEMLAELRESFATIHFTGPDASEAKQLVVEFEIGRMLGPTSLINDRLEGMRIPKGTPLDGRRKLFKAYYGLEQIVCPPDDYEDKVEAFLRLAGELVDKTKSLTLDQVLRKLAIELNLLVALQYFQRNEDGQIHMDPDQGLRPFRSAMGRLVLPHASEISTFDKQSQQALKRRFEMATNWLRAPQRIEEFAENFQTQLLLECVKQFVVEIQERLYGPPRLSARFVDTSLLEAAAHQMGFHEFQSIKDKSILIPPTPARELNRTTQALRDAAGQDPLSNLRKKRARSISEDEEDEEEENNPVARRSSHFRKSTTATTTTTIQPVSSFAGDDEIAPTRKSRLPQELIEVENPPQPPKPAAVSPAPKGTPAKRVQQMASPVSSDKKKERHAFTAEEDEAIRLGVEKYGLGEWTKIVRDPAYAKVFQTYGRTNIAIKDRYRTLSKNGGVAEI